MGLAEQRKEETNYIEELAKRYPRVSDSSVRSMLDFDRGFRRAATTLADNIAKILLSGAEYNEDHTKMLTMAAFVILHDNGCDLRWGQLWRER